MDSAFREVLEETGVADVVPYRSTVTNAIPLDVDSHHIPANPRKNEGAHVHHDFLYLAVSPGAGALTEVHAALRAPVAELRDSPDSRVRRVFRKLQQIGACL